MTHRLAVLLAGGVVPSSVWLYLAAGPAVDPHDVPGSLEAAAARMPKLEGDAWRGLAAAWLVATGAGAPLAPSLRDYASSLRALAETQREADIALAAPVATARMVMALPAVGILFGLALGFDTVGTLFGSPAGWACIGIGSVLMVVAARWNRRLVNSAGPRDVTPGIRCDLMAIAMTGGGSVDRARALVDDAADRYRLTESSDPVDAVLDLSRRAGVGAAELLRAEADESRRAARAEGAERAARLSVRLMLPLGLCVLPAFMVLGVVPLMIAVVSSTVVGF